MPRDLNSVSPTSAPPQWVLVLSLALALLLPLLTGTLLSWHSLGELDVWLHQKVGQDILNGEGFPHLNSYSFTEPNHPWTNHEWLFQILIAATGPDSVDPTAGVERWVILRTILCLGLMVILLFGDKPWNRSPGQLCWLAPGIMLGIALLWTRMLLRPELISYALLVLVIRLAESPITSRQSSNRWAGIFNRESQIFLVTLVWAQFHGFSALAPILWLLGGLLGFIPGSQLPRSTSKRLAGGTVLLIIALLLTPNGWQGLIFPLKALSQFSTEEVDIQSSISELQPLLRTTNGLHLTILAFKVSLVWGLTLVVLSWRRLSLLRVAFWLLAAVATFAAQRNIGFYAVAFTLLHTGLAGIRPLPIPRFPALPFRSASTVALPVLLTVAMAGWLWSGLISDGFYLAEGQSRRFGTGPTVGRFPFEATRLLSLSEGTRVFANVDAASLCLSRGRAKVFIDGRTEAYSARTWLQYQNLRLAGPDAPAVLDRSGVQKVLLTLGGSAFQPLLRRLLQTPDWKVSYAEPAGVLFTRATNSSSPEGQQALARFARQKPDLNQEYFSNTRRADQWAARATLAGLAGLESEQEIFLREGLTLSPDHPLINHNLANLLLQKNQFSAALLHFLKALEVNPRLGGAALNAGVCQMNLGDFESAQKLFARARELQPGNFRAWANHSLALQRLGRHSEALKALSEAVRLAPDNARLRKSLENLRSHR